MKRIIAACTFACTMVSCGSVLSLNTPYEQSSDNTAAVTTQQPEPTETVAGEYTGDVNLLGSLLGALAGSNAEEGNIDGTALTTDGIVSGLLGSILDAFATVDENSIVGTWNFKGSAFVFESENALANLGSDAIATQVESKVDQYLAKHNIKEGACSITFEEDGNFVLVAGERYVEGTYVLNAETKELVMTFGMFKTTALLIYDAGTINLVYQSDGLLKMMKAIGAKGGSSALSLLGKLLDQYDGMRIGMAFAK